MVAEEGTHTFPCPACGAEMDFDAEQGILACAYCGHTSKVPVTEQEIEEYDLKAALEEMIVAPQEMGYGDDKRSFRCESCGAVNTVDANIVSTECAFCGSNQVVPLEHTAQVVKPESLLPFEVDRRKAVVLFQQWLGRGFFRPSPLKKIAKEAQARLQGVYLPFWTFDAYTSSRWRAEAGYYYTTTETYWATGERGSRVQRSRSVQEVRWEPASGHLVLYYDDVVVPATHGAELPMLEEILPFDTADLVAYKPEYLSGWGAEAYTVDLEEAWAVGQSKIEGLVHSACARKVPGNTHRNLHVDTAFSNLTYKHVLFPVWIASYRYGGEVYNFVINGQTGEVRGSAPISWIKVAIVVVLVTIILCVLLWLFSVADASMVLQLHRSVFSI